MTDTLRAWYHDHFVMDGEHLEGKELRAHILRTLTDLERLKSETGGIG